ncbi:FAD-dependent oxidoreductase [Amycolatopsis sp. NPDC051373]|uniref:FAD-dependent oxidoreductase n=1 Tax=Amycolatopsis sp. NPDC051373 TaxID=3155801 RepID=UPI00344BE639
MAARPRVVVIGAGLLGCALADELTERGWTDVTVLDQGRPASAEAPGLVFQTDPDRTLTRFAQYTVAKYSSLTLDGGWCFQPVGGLELATTPERLAELKRRHGWATSWGVRSYLRSPAECAELHPLLDAAKVLGGLHTPGDGLAKPRRAAWAQARRATGRGARFLTGQRVTAIERSAGRVTGVVTGTDRFRADVVVSCAGAGAPEIGRLVELTVPLVPLAQHYARTTALPSLAGDNDDFTEAGKPVLRHGGLTVREHVDRLGIGHAAPRTAEPFARADFEQPWAEAARLLPALDDAKVEDGVTSLVAATPDGRPLVGEHPDLDGFWIAEAVASSHTAGVAREVARWLVDGQPRLDLHTSDLARFERAQLAPDHVRERAIRTVAGIRHDEPRRPLRTSPFYERHVALGACFAETGGWERPVWFSANETLSELSRVPSSGARTAGAEAIVARERVAVFDLTPATRLEITGPGALPFLQTMTTNQLGHTPGAVTYTLLLGEDGGVRSDLTVARLGAARFHVGANSALDVDWLRRHLPGDGTVQIHETTGGTCCLGLRGPLARQVLPELSTVDEDAFDTYVGNVPVLALRPPHEPGWELHTSADLGRLLWDTLWEAGQPHGIVAAGCEALTSLRLEDGRRTWGVDFTTEHDPYEAGLGFAVRMDKGYFLGRDALLGRSATTVGRTLTSLVTGDLVLGREPVYFEGHPAGYVTSAARGYTVENNLAYAWLPVECAKPGTPVEIEYFGERVPAVVADSAERTRRTA